LKIRYNCEYKAQFKQELNSSETYKDETHFSLFESTYTFNTLFLAIFSSDSERQNWMEAVSPKTMSTNPNEKIYKDWDCPQVEAENYAAKDSNELALKKGEAANVLRKMSDSGMEDSKDSVAGHYNAYRRINCSTSTLRV
jgi:hypothetical protein